MAEGGIKLYACDICGQEGLSEHDMRSHVLIEHVEGAISCPFCDLEGTTLEEMNWHVNVEHLDFLTPTRESTRSPGAPLELQNDVAMETVSSSSSSNSLGNSSSTSGGELPEVNKNAVTKVINKPVPMEITITEVLDSPKKQPPEVVVNCKSPVDDLEQSRKRAKLYLDVPQIAACRSKLLCKNNPGSNVGNCLGEENKLVKTVIDDDNNAIFHCPLCEWQTVSPGEITRHVNSEHLDILSPASAQIQIKDSENNVIEPNMPSTSGNNNKFECPLCGMHAANGTSLELHVNTKHVDILSPGKPQLTSPMSTSGGSESPLNCCPVCGMEFSNTSSLAVHVDGHFSADQTPVTEASDNLLAQELERRERAALKLQEQQQFEKLQELYGMSGKGNYKKQAERNLEKAVTNGQMTISDYYTRKIEIQQANVAGIDDGRSCTKGIIARLRQYYKTSPFTVSGIWLCSMCDHFAASYGDKGWGCGYRNLQMLLSALADSTTYEQILFNGRPLIPSIPKIQRLIETAWQKGFDTQGSEQLGGKVVETTKWIGATEIVATLSSLKIKCQLLDFHAPTGKDGTHPRLFEWVRDYFRKDSEFKAPLYLQHQGHSRTIIGVEELKDGSLRLLLFDPSCSRKQMQQFLGDINANLMRSLRRSLNSMKAKQYQIVAIAGVLSQQEYEESKVMKSDRIP